MQYRIQITYFDRDDQPVTLLMKKEEISEFFQKLQNNSPYMNENTNVGFWTSLDKIRHIIITPQKEEALIEKVGESSGDVGTVQEGDENSEA